MRAMQRALSCRISRPVNRRTMYARAVCKRANAGHEAEVAGEGYGKSSGQVYVI
jgi:hypothetical protein